MWISYGDVLDFLNTDLEEIVLGLSDCSCK